MSPPSAGRVNKEAWGRFPAGSELSGTRGPLRASPEGGAPEFWTLPRRFERSVGWQCVRLVTPQIESWIRPAGVMASVWTKIIDGSSLARNGVE